MACAVKLDYSEAKVLVLTVPRGKTQIKKSVVSDLDAVDDMTSFVPDNTCCCIAVYR